jgi:hypothetical protein
MNVPVVYMKRDVMILMQAIPFRGPLEGVGLENRDFFGPEMALSETSAIWAKKVVGILGFPPPLIWGIFCTATIITYLLTFRFHGTGTTRPWPSGPAPTPDSLGLTQL